MTDKSMKKKTLTFRLNPKQFPFEVVTRHLSATQKRKFKAVVKERLKEIKQHFRRDGWPLHWRCIEEEIFMRVFGSLIETYLMAQFLSVRRDLVLEGREDGFYLQKRSHNLKNRSKRRKAA